MTEWLMILAMGFGGMMFAAGGTGPKFVRRYIMPLALGAVAFFGGIIWWRALSYSLTQLGTLHMGYGQSLPYWRKMITAIAYVLPTLFIGFSPWQIIAPLGFILMFILSNWKPTANIFVWKIVEFFTGALYGAVIAHLLT